MVAVAGYRGTSAQDLIRSAQDHVSDLRERLRWMTPRQMAEAQTLSEGAAAWRTPLTVEPVCEVSRHTGEEHAAGRAIEPPQTEVGGWEATLRVPSTSSLQLAAWWYSRYVASMLWTCCARFSDEWRWRPVNVSSVFVNISTAVYFILILFPLFVWFARMSLSPYDSGQ